MPEPADPGKGAAVRLAIMGDVMLGRLVSDEIVRRDPAAFWGDILPELRAADAVLANLECCISRRGAPWSETPKRFHFRADPAAIAVLKAANLRYVSLANNHVLDYGTEAFADTLTLLDEAGIAHAGAGHSLSEARRPARFSVKGLQIAGFSICDHERPFAATDSRPGIVHVDPERDREPWPDAGTIAAARQAGADLVVVSAHLGPNMVLHPSETLRRYTQRLVDCGATIIHGHSAHVFQGVERIGRSVILHDTGDAIDDYSVDPTLRNDWSFLFLLDVGMEGVRHLVLRPLRLGFADVSYATGAEAEAICARMRELSAEMGTDLKPCPEGLRLSFAAGA